jgi:hypothetical protein
MRYFVALLVLLVMIYILSFARYNWKAKNKLAAIGAALLAIAAFSLSFFVLFIGNYEI